MFPKALVRCRVPAYTLAGSGATVGASMQQRIPMSEMLSEAALDQLFREARTFNAWFPKA